MNAIIAIFKCNSPLLSFCWKPIYLHCMVVFTILLGTALLQRFASMSLVPSGLGDITQEEQPYMTFAQELCHKLAPEIDRFQPGLVTQSIPPRKDKGLVSVQISDIEDKNHFHVIIEKDTREVIVFSHVIEGQVGEATSHRAASRTEDKQAERKAALEIAKQTLNSFYEAGALPYREPLGVTVERPGDWIMQWHYRDCCIVMDIRLGEERTVAFRVRRHPRPLTQADVPLLKRGCPYCLGFGKTPEHTYEKLHAPSPFFIRH